MTDQQALEVIERICGDDFCANLDMRDVTGGLNEEGLKTAAQKLSAIYKISHSFVKLHTCFHVHDGWRAEAERILAADEAEEVPSA